MATTKESRKLPLDRPFAPAVLRRAQAAIRNYEVILHQEEDGAWFGHGVELPGAMGDGATPEACIASTRDSMLVCAAAMLEDGQKLPSPACEEKRDVQINIRLTRHEQLRIAAAAKSGGFASVADFVRRQVVAAA